MVVTSETMNERGALQGESGIFVRNLDKAFGSPTLAVRALDQINLTVRQGEFLCIVGPSGCGKTTLLRILAGLESVTSGAIEIGTPSSHRPVNSMIFQGD